MLFGPSADSSREITAKFGGGEEFFDLGKDDNAEEMGMFLHLTQRRSYFGTPLELFAGSMKLRLNGPMPFTCKIVSPSIHAKW
jgi:hypothetical protein